MTTITTTLQGAVINFTRALACEMGRERITVNHLPGFFSEPHDGRWSAQGDGRAAPPLVMTKT
jgi:NAD(P)-dependent dehydrogenase (short-subunit alcohol dehydrogenase family)